MKFILILLALSFSTSLMANVKNNVKCKSPEVMAQVEAAYAQAQTTLNRIIESENYIDNWVFADQTSIERGGKTFKVSADNKDSHIYIIGAQMQRCTKHEANMALRMVMCAEYSKPAYEIHFIPARYHDVEGNSLVWMQTRVSIGKFVLENPNDCTVETSSELSWDFTFDRIVE